MLGAPVHAAPRDDEGPGLEAEGAGWCWLAAGGGGVPGALLPAAPRGVEGPGLEAEGAGCGEGLRA